MDEPIRVDRVEMFLAWLRLIPSDPPFWDRPEFPHLFGDLTPAESSTAVEEFRRRWRAADEVARQLAVLREQLEAQS